MRASSATSSRVSGTARAALVSAAEMTSASRRSFSTGLSANPASTQAPVAASAMPMAPPVAKPLLSRDRIASTPSRSAPTTTTHAPPSRSEATEARIRSPLPGRPGVARNSTGRVRAASNWRSSSSGRSCFTS